MTTWTIPLTEYTNDSDKGITVAHWRVTAEDGDYSASAYGTCSFTPDPTDPNFVPFESLTEADVLVWVKDAIDADAIEASLADKIEADKNPVTVAGVPW